MPAGRKKGDIVPATQEAAKRRMFYDTWLQNGRRGKDAAMAVGILEKSACSMASQWLKRPDFVEELARIDGAARAKSDVTVERVVAELANIGFHNIAGAFNEDGSVKPIAEWPEGLQRSCASFEVEEEIVGAEGEEEFAMQVTKVRLKKVKFAPKTDALDKLMKHFPEGYAAQRLQVEDVTDHGAQLEAARERRAKALAAAKVVTVTREPDE